MLAHKTIFKTPLLLLAMLCLQSTAQQSTRLINNWEFVRKDLGSVWEAVRAIPKDDNPENYPVWSNISLPHCVNAEDAVNPDITYYQGAAWYRSKLSIENPYANGRTLLHFEGAGQKTDVYVYTTKVVSHIGGYDEWTVDITDAVQAFKKTEAYQKQFRNKVPIVIRCDNSRDAEMIPSNLSDFNIYGGIYRYLNLVYTPALSIDKIFASATVDKDGKHGKIDVKARWYNPLNISNAKLQLQLVAPDGKRVGQFETVLTDLSNDNTIHSFSIDKPALWNPDKPQLYTVEVTVSTDNTSCTKSEKIGFKNFEFVKKGPFMLNGQRVLLRGTQRQEDHAGVAAAMTEDMMRTEMLMIKEMGANFIRLGHFQQSRTILNLCDSLGIMVWEEIPWCRGGLGGKAYQQQAKQMLTNMIEQHYNHAAVIIWGLGNENDWPNEFPIFDKEAIRAFMKELNVLAHQLDGSRKTAIRRCDFCKDIVDVYSPSIWRGWYKGLFTEYKKIADEESNKVDRFLHAEWGGDSHAGRHAEKNQTLFQDASMQKDMDYFNHAAKLSKDSSWSESYICDLFDWHLKEQETMPLLTGSAQWVFKDFSTPIRPNNPLPYINQKGVVERDLTKKEGYYVFQSYWSAKPMAHIYGHTWPVRWGNDGEEKMVKVYSNCTEAELFVNGKSYGMKKRNSQDFPAAGLHWNVVFNKGENTVKVIAQQHAIKVEDTIRFIYQTEKWSNPSKIVIKKIKDENGIAVVEARLLDDKNIFCLDADNRIRFGITGDGKLLAEQGTSTGSRLLEVYNGRAIIKVATNNGNNIISVQCEGLPTAFLQL